MNPSMKPALLIALALGCWAQTVSPRDVPPKLVKHTVIDGYCLARVSVVWDCPDGKLTINNGHTVTNDEHVDAKTEAITHREAEETCEDKSRFLLHDAGGKGHCVDLLGTDTKGSEGTAGSVSPVLTDSMILPWVVCTRYYLDTSTGVMYCRPKEPK